MPYGVQLLTSITSNWTLIKIVKLLGALTPHEPRLGKKLVEPMSNLISTTTAMSLTYECINTVISGMAEHKQVLQLCVSKLRLLLDDPDQNLKYLGLLAVGKILAVNPKAVIEHRELVLKCLDDSDESIRVRALDLLVGMVSKKNLADIVKRLLIHMAGIDSTVYRDEVVAKILAMCSQSNYQYVTDFEWYIQILCELTKVEGTRHGRLLAEQLMDVVIRVKVVRPYALPKMVDLLNAPHLFSGPAEKGAICEVLYAAAWLCGEFAGHFDNAAVPIEALLRSQVTGLPSHIQAVYVHNIIKLYTATLARRATAEPGSAEGAETVDLVELGERIIKRLQAFSQSADLEVQERACMCSQLMRYMVEAERSNDRTLGEEVASLFRDELNPVAPKAQRKVPLPEGLNLDEWINEPPSDSVSDAEAEAAAAGARPDVALDFGLPAAAATTDAGAPDHATEEELERRRYMRKQAQLANPHYLRTDVRPRSAAGLDADDVPVVQLHLGMPLTISEPRTAGGKGKRAHGRRHRRGADRDSDAEDDAESRGQQPQRAYEVLAVADMPEGAVFSDKDDDDADTPENRLRKALNVDISKPLDDSERLPVPQHRVVPAQPLQPPSATAHASRGRKKHHRKAADGHGAHEDGKKSHSKHRRHARDAAASAPTTTGSVPGEGAHETPGPPAPVQAAAAVADDMAFWLSPAQPSSGPASASASAPNVARSATKTPPLPPEPEPRRQHHTRHQHRHHHPHHNDNDGGGKAATSTKKHAKSDAGGGHSAPSASAAVDEPRRADFLSLDDLAEPVAPLRSLTEDSMLRLTYEVRADASQLHEFYVTLGVANVSAMLVRSMAINVVDSINTKLVRPPGADALPVPFTLPAGGSGTVHVAFTVNSIMVPLVVHGVLSYAYQTPEGVSSGKLDFKLRVPCSTFIVAQERDHTQLSVLLQDKEALCAAVSAKLSVARDVSFALVVHRICDAVHLAVVEQVRCGRARAASALPLNAAAGAQLDLMASLYGITIQDQHVCVLVKQPGAGQLSIDVKSSAPQLAASVVDEIRSVFAT